ncbi:MAG: methyltransferase domain-containing protein [Deltaproteobacteria bacterium]|nr:methyltransferase domain-containing protein [Deltaproteobacteria bacterium]MBN2671742.1 methyltransferase domain-containing protein [Deltaproteobacteria bacterium]
MISRDEKLADYFGVTTAMVPLLDELLRDLYALGSFPHDIVDQMRCVDIDYSSRILDVGCGKGAVSIAVAQRFQCRVLGLDFFESFIEYARMSALKASVRHLCTFIQADVHTDLSDQEPFDMAVFASVGPIFGTHVDTLRRLKTAVRPGGYVLLDDAYRTDDAPIGVPGYESCAGYDETILQLTRDGNRIVSERVYPPAAIQQMNQRYCQRICERAEALKKAYPNLSDEIDDFVAREAEENRVLENHMACATWIVQLGDGEQSG